MKKSFSKKTLALLLTLALVLSSMMAGIAVVSAEETVPVIWGGQEDVATAFAGGDGSKANPYQISNGAELAYLMTIIKSDTANDAPKTTGKYYELTADIYLNDVSNPNWMDNANAWYSFSNRFGGNLNGNDYTVYGIYYNGEGSGYCGLIPVVDSWNNNVTIQNITVSAAYINGSIVGGITGRIYGGNKKVVSLLDCTVTSDVEVVGASYQGGFVGFVQPASSYYQLTNPSSEANVNNKIFGYNDGLSCVTYNGYDVATAFAGGKGTVEDPFEIATKEQLFKMVLDDKTTGVYYELVADIDLNDTTSSDWKLYATNWIRPYHVFNGTFDGNGKTINGLYYNGAANNIALFKETGANAVVKNVIFTNASINTTASYGAAIVTGMAGGTFSKIYIDATCEVIAPNAKGAAGIVTYGSSDVTISDSAVLGTIVGNGRVGAFIGDFWGGALKVTNCFTTTNLPISGNRGLTNPENNFALVGDSSSTTVLEAEQMQGAAAKDNMTLDFKYTWEVGAEGEYPTLNFEGFNGVEGEAWEGVVAAKYAGGTGTKEDPYIIKTAEQLAKLVTEIATPGQYYKLGADIIINDTTAENWTKTAKGWYAYNAGAEFASIYFQGTLDGDGHTISGLYYEGTDYYFGLFPGIKGNAVIKNVIFADSYINGTKMMGLVAAYAAGDAKFENCIITDTVTVIGDHAAGFVAYGSGVLTFNNCGVFANIDGVTHEGALIADVWGGYKYANGCVATMTFSTKRTFVGDDNYAEVDATTIMGAAAKENMPLLSWNDAWFVTEGYPTVFGTPVACDHVYDDTCTDAYCNVCGAKRVVDGHVYDNECDAECNVCGDVREGVGHIDEDANNVCDKCEAELTVPHEHTYGDWIVETKATVDADGLKYQECSCGDRIEKVIPRVLNFKTKTLALQSNISIIFRVDPVYFTTHGYTNPVVTFNFLGVEYPVTEYTVTEKGYEFAFNIVAPHQMKEMVYATLSAEYEGVVYTSAAQEYSIWTYCNNQLTKNSANPAYKKVMALLVDILNYGAAAQNYITKGQVAPEALANAELTDDQKALGNQEVISYADEKQLKDELVEGAIADIKVAGLTLQDSVVMNFKFELLNGAAKDGLVAVVTAAGKTWEIEASEFTYETTSGRWVINFNGLNPAQMREKVSVHLEKDGVIVSDTATYSVESYGLSTAAQGDARLAALVEAMAKYGRSAKAYNG